MANRNKAPVTKTGKETKRQAKTKAVTDTAIQKSLKATASLIYIGPNLPGGALAKYTIFRDGLTPHIKALIEKYAEIATLLVPVEQFAEADSLVRQPGTLEHTAYTTIKTKGVI